MKHTYFVCATVHTEAILDKIINTNVELEHSDFLRRGDIAKLLVEAIPRCKTVINFWEYGEHHSTEQYRDAKIIGTAFDIAGQLMFIANHIDNNPIQQTKDSLLRIAKILYSAHTKNS